MYNKLPTHKISLALVADIVCYFHQKNTPSIQEICEYTGRSLSYIKSGLTCAQLLNILTLDKNGTYIIDKKVSSFFARSMDISSKTALLKYYFQNFNALMSFIRYCQNGDTAIISARRVLTLYNFCNKDSKFLSELFIAWGNELNLYELDNNRLVLDPSLKDKYKQIVPQVLISDDKLAIRLYVSNHLGQEVFDYLDKDDIDELVDSFMKYSSNPKDSINTAGKVFEDFLRKIGIHVNVALLKCHGIGQVANALYNNKDSSGNIDYKIHSKHYSISTSLSDIRNMCGHGNEAKTMKKWVTTPESALNYATLTLCTIKSIYFFVYKDKFLY